MKITVTEVEIHCPDCDRVCLVDDDGTCSACGASQWDCST